MGQARPERPVWIQQTWMCQHSHGWRLTLLRSTRVSKETCVNTYYKCVKRDVLDTFVRMSREMYFKLTHCQNIQRNVLVTFVGTCSNKCDKYRDVSRNDVLTNVTSVHRCTWHRYNIKRHVLDCDICNNNTKNVSGAWETYINTTYMPKEMYTNSALIPWQRRFKGTWTSSGPCAPRERTP